MRHFLVTLLAGFLGSLLALFAFVFLGLAFSVALVLGSDGVAFVEDESVLLLDLAGTLPEEAPFDLLGAALGTFDLTLLDVTDALEKAAVDERIEAVWLRPDGIAASWATLSEVRTALELYRASGKPLYASSGADGFDEAAYYLASVADSVFTPPEAGFELNGFYLSTPFFAGTLDKLGIEPQVIRAGAYKSAAETFTNRGFSPENREQYAALLDGVSETFLAAVADARELSAEELEVTIDAGGLYEAQEALDAGLVDDLLYEAEVLDVLRGLTGQAPDEDLRTVGVEDYAYVPRTDAGLDAGDPDNVIAVVYAVGQIVPGESTPDTGSGALLGSDTFTQTMRDAASDEDVRAIVVRVDSPGGSATASDAMWNAVEEASGQMPVVVSMGSVAASGGYYLAAPADRIVADANTVTGSIGVISLLFDATEFLNDRLGVTLDGLQTGPTAGVYAFGEPLDAREEAVLERSTERVYDTFVTRVADGRGLAPETVRALGGGRVYTGADALDLGLVDVLGDLGDAIGVAADMAGLEPDGYQLWFLPPEKSFLEELGFVVSAQASALLTRFRPLSPAEQVMRRQADLLRDAVRLHATPYTLLLSDVWVR
ncbi:MAG: signal peptide peptidase SppA [Bacteroidota bacterium]